MLRKTEGRKKNMIRKDTYTPMFIAALFTIAKTWKHPKCPLTEEWIKKIRHTHTHTHTPEYYSAIKKNEIMPFAETWHSAFHGVANSRTRLSDELILSEVSQTEEKYHMTDLMCGI